MNESKSVMVGMGATIFGWTDRHAATVTRISASGKSVFVKRDQAVRTDKNGMSEDQTWSTTPDESAPEERFTWHALSGRWIAGKGRNGLTIGARHHYRDPSF